LEKIMKSTRVSILLSILPVVLAALACTMFVGGPDYPDERVPVSTEAVGNLKDQISAAETSAAQNGTLTLTLNEVQITSLLAAKLNEQSDPFLTEPQVYLRNGEIQIYGKAVQGNFQANVRIILTVTLDTNGKPIIHITSTDLGPLPAPESLNSAISQMIDEIFTGAIGPAAIGFRLETITIADGVMTLTGRVR
jgi:uncharacterized protein YpmS